MGLGKDHATAKRSPPHREPGICARITHGPLACFAEAVTALASSLPDQ
jgi:hypothetical protein